MPRPARSPRAGGPNVAVLSAAAVVVVALVAVAVVTLLFDDDDGGGDDGAVPTEQSDTTLSAGCTEIHSGHNTMSWNPLMADEMIECGWPYDPFATTLDGGEEDGALDGAPFEPRRYGDLWTMIGDTGLGVCSVTNLPDQPAAGFAFGFSYAAASPGCPDAAPTVEMLVREYSTRPQRDAAAHEAATIDDPPPVLVLGRWAITLHGDDQAERDALADGLTGLGAVRLGV